MFAFQSCRSCFQNQQQGRVSRLKQHARELCRDKISVALSSDCHPQIEEAFWEYVIALEAAAIIQHRKKKVDPIYLGIY